jgi:hypothetical protein
VDLYMRALGWTLLILGPLFALAYCVGSRS